MSLSKTTHHSSLAKQKAAELTGVSRWPGVEGWSREMAQSILRIGLSRAASARLEQLKKKKQLGAITLREFIEISRHERAGRALRWIQQEAQRFLNGDSIQSLSA